MSEKKLTPWFDGDVKPVRTGVYETSLAGSFQFWNGDYWGGYGTDIDRAERDSRYKSARQNAPWRGLARRPR